MNELKNTVEAFNLYQRAIGNSPATLEYYKYCLNPFVKHFGIEFDVNGFTKQNLRQYAANMSMVTKNASARLQGRYFIVPGTII